VLHWKLDEGGGTRAADSSGQGNTGTVVNAAAGNWVAGRHGLALDITGGSPYVLGANLASPLSGDMTLSCWLTSRSSAGLALALASGAGAEWPLCEDGDLGRPGWAGAGGPATALYAPWSIHLDGKWHHAAFVREGTTYRLYVDNRYVGACGGTVVSYARALAGRNTAGTGWQGKLDDVRLYDRALSWGEVGSLYAGEGVGPLDADADGMADVWEIAHFGSISAVDGAAGFDRDGDGHNNLAEYVLGTDPLAASNALRVLITLDGGQVVVSYPTVQAAGAAYAGRTRRYDMESTSNLTVGAWQSVAGATNVPGNNEQAAYTNAFPDRVRAFRVKARLE